MASSIVVYFSDLTNKISSNLTNSNALVACVLQQIIINYLTNQYIVTAAENNDIIITFSLIIQHF